MGLLCTKDRPVAEASTCTTHDIHKGQTSVPSVRFEPAVPPSQWPHTCALDCPVTGIVTIVRNTDTLCGRNGVFYFHAKASCRVVDTGQRLGR